VLTGWTLFATPDQDEAHGAIEIHVTGSIHEFNAGLEERIDDRFGKVSGDEKRARRITARVVS
jgi:ABC-type uncharacterized transport system ATPase component